MEAAAVAHAEKLSHEDAGGENRRNLAHKGMIRKDLKTGRGWKVKEKVTGGRRCRRRRTCGLKQARLEQALPREALVGRFISHHRNQ